MRGTEQRLSSGVHAEPEFGIEQLENVSELPLPTKRMNMNA